MRRGGIDWVCGPCLVEINEEPAHEQIAEVIYNVLLLC